MTARNYWENSTYKKNLLFIVETLQKNNIKVIVMQYPRVSVMPLRDLLSDKKDIYFVENISNFEEFLKSHTFQDAFEDKFAIDFGHFTKAGSELVAKNLSEIILKVRNIKE